MKSQDIRKNEQRPPAHGGQFLETLVQLTIGWYLLLCFLHLLSGRPLWNDEECVFRSLKAFSSSDLFHEPLQALQVFPRVYLFLIQKFARLFDNNLIALRVPSFICMLTAFLIWLKIASVELKNRFDLWTFVLSWTASVVLIYYSAELKQYSMDVLSASVFLLFLQHQEALEKIKPAWKFNLLLVLLPAFVFFSYPAYFFIPFPLWNLVVAWKRGGKLSSVLIYLSSFIAMSVLSYQFDMQHRPVNVLLREWGDYFISLDSGEKFFQTFGEGTMNLVGRWFVERPKILKHFGIFFVMLGFLRMFPEFRNWLRQKTWRFHSVGDIALLMYGELLILGTLKKYPFTVPRTSLFFCPLLLLLTVKALRSLSDRHPVLRFPHFAYIYYLVFVSIGISFFVFNKVLSFRPVLWGLP